jgi:hypothetical protein
VFYVQHYQKEKNTVKWCYFGSYNRFREEYREKIDETDVPTAHNYTQQNGGFPHHQKKQESTFISQYRQGVFGADRLVWLGYHPYEVMVAGSNPARPTMNAVSLHERRLN